MIHDLQFFNRKAVFHIHVFNIKSTFSLGYVMFTLFEYELLSIESSVLFNDKLYDT